MTSCDAMCRASQCLASLTVQIAIVTYAQERDSESVCAWADLSLLSSSRQPDSVVARLLQPETKSRALTSKLMIRLGTLSQYVPNCT